LRQAAARARERGAGGARGRGLVGYPAAQLIEELSFLAYHFHWAPADIMDLEHRDRRRWVREISALNERINEG
jgi:hypothetical protein